tara:strand:+ start:405 stop:611 length:207 start_codon:yes stop_codon:yes gene_type:complete
MNEIFKQVKFLTESDQSVMIELNVQRDGVNMTFTDEPKGACYHLYLSYQEALAIADELLKCVNENKDE